MGFENATPPEGQKEIVFEKEEKTVDISNNYLVLQAMRMQQETILEQQRTINIYAKQQTQFETPTTSPAGGLDMATLVPIIKQIIAGFTQGGPPHV